MIYDMTCLSYMSYMLRPQERSALPTAYSDYYSVKLL